ncbi:MAG TPA: hypothetical protein VJ183_11255 [Chloroflexia bacterium]|nr:hypothetical protein [Chloroflexia bacterium]
MTRTGIEFIDDLRKEWSAGAVTRDDALERLLPWEDDLASRSEQELEAAWALRQEIESGVADASLPNGPSEASPAPTLPAQEAAQAPDAEIRDMLADLRANPLLTLHDIGAARALCVHLGEVDAARGDKYVRTRCDEIEEKVKGQTKVVQQEVEEATQLLQEAPDIAEKLRACELLRERLSDIDMLHPDEPTLPDMVAWCEQTRQELLTLLAERDLLLADVASLTAPDEDDWFDIGLVESTKQRLIIMSDTPLAKDDTGFRRAAKDLTARLNEHLSSRLKPGVTPDKQTVAEYEEVLRLAKQAPEAIDAYRVKAYGDTLAAAQAELARIERGSEQPARTIPSTPPPQPKSTAGSQPGAAILHDDVPQSHSHLPQATQPVDSNRSVAMPGQGSVRLMPPPPPPRVQPGMGTVISSTQPVTNPTSTPPGTPPMPWSATAPGMTMPPSSTGGAPAYSQPAPAYAPAGGGLRLSPAVWATIAGGVIAFILVIVLIVVLATSRGGGAISNSSAREAAESFLTNAAARKFDAAAALMTPQLSNQGVSAATIQQWVQNSEVQVAGTLASAQVDTVNEIGDTATANFTFIFNNAQGRVALNGQIGLKKEGNKWLVSDF